MLGPARRAATPNLTHFLWFGIRPAIRLSCPEGLTFTMGLSADKESFYTPGAGISTNGPRTDMRRIVHREFPARTPSDPCGSKAKITRFAITEWRTPGRQVHVPITDRSSLTWFPSLSRAVTRGPSPVRISFKRLTPFECMSTCRDMCCRHFCLPADNRGKGSCTGQSPPIGSKAPAPHPGRHDSTQLAGQSSLLWSTPQFRLVSYLFA